MVTTGPSESLVPCLKVWCLVTVPLALLLGADSAIADPQAGHMARIEIPEIPVGPRHRITTNDLIHLRDIDSLSVSPDGKRFAVLLRQADVQSNSYKTGWFVGSTAGGALSFLGDGGEARLARGEDGSVAGDITGSVSRWSPDNQWIAYTVERNDQVQVWRSSVAGVQQQLTHNSADVLDFRWSKDGHRLLFTVDAPRAALARQQDDGDRNGFRLDEFQWMSEIVYYARPVHPLPPDPVVWVLDVDNGIEHVGAATDAGELKRLVDAESHPERGGAADKPHVRSYSAAASPPVLRADGAAAWLERVDIHEHGLIPLARVVASYPRRGKPIRCELEECVGRFFPRLWWSGDGTHVVIWRKGNSSGTGTDGIYSWRPGARSLRRILKSEDDKFSECELVGSRLVCIRETPTIPAHIAALDTATGKVTVLADVNPEFRNVELGAVEHFEWALSPQAQRFGYPSKSHGYIVYPPDFDPTNKYPVFIAPYVAQGFLRGDVGDEQPMLAYAASDIVVINSEFPFSYSSFGTEDMAKDAYSPELGFPYLTVLADATSEALNTVIKRGFIDSTRVGIGGVSHGTFVPLFMMQRGDRLAALSIAGSVYSDVGAFFETYAHLARRLERGETMTWPESREFWSQIDIADHVDTVDAPILLNVADREFFFGYRLSRRLSEANKPLEEYIFPDEYHVIWQPAHRHAIYNRNLDWFRFWLQDYEDPDPAKKEQYARWRKLRELQCLNPRSARDYCGMSP